MSDRKMKKYAYQKRSRTSFHLYIQNNHGMTLVEVLMALLIMSIVLGAMGSIYLVSMKYIDTYTSKRQTKLMIDTTLDAMLNRLTYATQIYISDTPFVPADWEGKACYYYKFDNCREEGKGGVVSTEDMEALFDSSLYDNGYLHCIIDFDNHNSSSKQKNLFIQLSFYNHKGELVYKRDRQIDIMNMTYGDTDISGMKGENKEKDLYIYYRKDVEVTGYEEEIGNIFLQLYNRYTRENPDYYKNFTLNTTISCEDNESIKIGPVNSRSGTIMWQYRASHLAIKPEQNWGLTIHEENRDKSLLIIENERLQNWGIESLNGKQTAMKENVFYMLPYHFVNISERLDILYYVENTWEFEGEVMGRTRQTQLIYNNEEKKWYYLKIGAGQRCVSLTADGIEYEGFPVKEGVRLQYTYLDEKGSTLKKEAVIMSSVQIKMFFKTFGEPLSEMKNR